jgi:hypothetical protein
LEILAHHRYGEIENTAQRFILEWFLAVTAFLVHNPGLAIAVNSERDRICQYKLGHSGVSLFFKKY